MPPSAGAQQLDVYGDDYATPDGTCLRDYVHVTDLAEAHLLALDRLEHGSITVNLGNGTGHSVLEVIAHGRTRIRTQGAVPHLPAPTWRRGDPGRIVRAREKRPGLAAALRRARRDRAHRAAMARGAPERLCGLKGRAGTVFAIALAAALLVWPAVWNGYPLVFADTGTYLSQAIEHYVGWDRPVFYSLFMLPLHLTLTTWPVIAVQALLLAHVLHLTRRTLLPEGAGVVAGAHGGRADGGDVAAVVRRAAHA